MKVHSLIVKTDKIIIKVASNKKFQRGVLGFVR